jgi:predicted Zn-dependent peptidase
VRGFENNRKVILDEINMVNDEPLLYQWVLFHKELFKGTPLGKPVYGNVKSVREMSRTDMVKYYSANYSPKNMVLGVVGGVCEADLQKIGDYFTLKKPHGRDNALEVPQKNRKIKVIEKKKINQSYMVLGYRTIPRLHIDSYALDVIHAVLGRGQSGWMFDEIRNKKALAYNVNVEHQPELDYGVFAVNVGTRKKNVEKVVKLITKNFEKLQKLSPAQLEEAKTFVEGNRILDWEENLNRGDSMCFYEHAGNFTAAGQYLEKIAEVTLEDVKRVAEKYLNEKYTLTVLEEE